MTSEQIAELREMLRAEFLPVWGTTDGRVVTWTTTPDVSKRVALALNALPKLLDEREALLEACRVAASDHANSWQTKEAASAALAKADSP